jgi:hypothetical protein
MQSRCQGFFFNAYPDRRGQTPLRLLASASSIVIFTTSRTEPAPHRQRGDPPPGHTGNVRPEERVSPMRPVDRT